MAESVRGEDIRIVAATIKGVVFERLSSLVPGLQDIGYEKAIADPSLVDGCISVFRKHRNQFSDLMLDAEGNAVTDDDTPIHPCGRSVNDIIAMVARTCAKRHLLSKAAPAGGKTSSKKQVRSKASGFRAFLAKLGLGNAGQAKVTKPENATYSAIKEHLHHDWQIPLIPIYAEMPTAVLKAIGPSLESYRDPEKLRILSTIAASTFARAKEVAGDLADEMVETDPSVAKTVERVGKRSFNRLRKNLRRADGKNKDQFWALFANRDVLNSLSNVNGRELREFAPHLGEICHSTIDTLVDTLPPMKINAFLGAAKETLGREGFATIFGDQKQSRLVYTLSKKASELRHKEESLAEFSEQVRVLFRAFLRNPKDFGKTL